MGLFYTASPNELLQIRNNIFLEFGLPALQVNGFQMSPFSTAWYGKNPGIGYSYELCRISDSNLEILYVHIVKGDVWIQIFLNIFVVLPELSSLSQLLNKDGLKFHLPPNALSKMRLKSDEISQFPIFNYDYMFKNHRIKSYHSRAGLLQRSEELGKTIASDLYDINNFVKHWHRLHIPNKTTWEGIIIS